MNRSLRGDVAESQHGVVFVDNVGGDLAPNDLAENGVGHQPLSRVPNASPPGRMSDSVTGTICPRIDAGAAN